jgi:hypothetical protein
MSRFRPLPLLALVSALAAFPASANANKLRNSTFGTGLEGWQVVLDPNFQVLWSSAAGHLGAGSLLLATTGTGTANDAVLTQVVNVTAGQTYSFGTYFWYSPDSATNASGFMQIYWRTELDGGGTYIKLENTPLTPYTPGVWMLSQKTLIAPAGAQSAIVKLYLIAAENKNVLALFDDPFVFGGVNGGVIGDVNGDGKLDVADVFFLINNLFAGGPLPIGPADANADDRVDVSDVFYLVNYFFAGGDPPVE